MIFMSRYTPDGDYPQLAEKLVRSCEKFDLRHDVCEVPPIESWNEAVHHKPAWILSKLLTSREPVCWLDTDCEVIKLPSLLLNTARDFGCYNWNADPLNAGQYDRIDSLRVSGGVLMFGYTAPAIELLCRWINAIQESPDKAGTDPVLDRVYNTSRPPVRPLWLPQAYNRHDTKWPNIDPVINHAYRNRGHRTAATEPTKPASPQQHLKARSMFMFHYADLYEAVVKQHDPSLQATFVEIGCWLGDSSSFMAKQIKDSGKAIRFYCIDTWAGSEGIAWMQPIVDECGGDMLPAWQRRMQEDGVADYATPLKGRSLEMVNRFADGSVDYLMIDGDHRYEAVKADILTWMPKIRPGGIMSGDDYDRNSHPGVPQAVDEILGTANIQVHGRWWAYRKPKEAV